ncbi:T9SS type A sorting domain-containing protein [Dyadobacter helix]
MPVHQLNSGMYIVRLTSSEKSISQKILVVQ